MKVGLLLPTLNAEGFLASWCAALAQQTLQPDRVLVIDSSSTDRTVEMASASGFEVEIIPRRNFSHGGTRQYGTERLADCDIVVCMTQDAILADIRSLETLISVFADTNIAVAYGRQLPHPGAGPLASQSRAFNYPDYSYTCSVDTFNKKGLRAAFCSNSFAAWRRKSLAAIGGFESDLPLAEDMYACARLMIAGFESHYCASARVYHSHDFSYKEEFRRYLLTGQTHYLHPWILKHAVNAESEGLRLLRHRIRELSAHGPLVLMDGILRTALGFIAYRLGRAGYKVKRG